MALKDIIQKIESEGNQKISLMVKEWDDKINSEKDSKTKEIDRYFEEEKEKIIKSIDEKQNKIVLDAKLEQRNKVLEQKIQKINSIFETVLEDYKKMSDKEYLTILEKLIKNVENLIESNHIELILNSNDKKKFGKNLIKTFGNNYKLSNETRNILGGVIIKDGKIEYNQSFDLIFKNKKETLQQEVGKIINVI